MINTKISKYLSLSIILKTLKNDFSTQVLNLALSNSNTVPFETVKI